MKCGCGEKVLVQESAEEQTVVCSGCGAIHTVAPFQLEVPVCPTHPGERIRSKCVECGKPICSQCRDEFGYYCGVPCKTRGLEKAERDEDAIAERKEMEAADRTGRAVYETWRKVAIYGGGTLAVLLVLWITGVIGSKAGKEIWSAEWKDRRPVRLIDAGSCIGALLSDGTYVRLDANDGTVLGETSPVEKTEFFWGGGVVASHPGLLALQQGGTLVVLDPETGEIRWTDDPPAGERSEMEFFFARRTWSSDGERMFRVEKGRVTALGAENGDRLWEWGEPTDGGDGEGDGGGEEGFVFGGEIGLFPGKGLLWIRKSARMRMKSRQKEGEVIAPALDVLLDAATGKERWRHVAVEGEADPDASGGEFMEGLIGMFGLETGPQFPCFMDQGMLFLGEEALRMRSFSDGAELWSLKLPEKGPDEVPPIVAVLPTSQGILVHFNGVFRMLDPETGKERWGLKGPDIVTRIKPMADRLLVSAAARESFLKKLEDPSFPLAGKQAWREVIPEISGQPDLELCKPLQLCIDPADRRIVWMKPAGGEEGIPVSDGFLRLHVIMALGAETQTSLRFFSADDGELQWERSHPGSASHPLIRGDRLYYVWTASDFKLMGPCSGADDPVPGGIRAVRLD